MNENSEILPQEILPPEQTAPPKRTAKKILVVDDNPDALKNAEEILKKARYDVVTLNNPKFIFKVIKGEWPDAIVLDIIMRPVDGYSVCAEIKKAYADKIPVLLCTAQSYEQDFIQRAHKEFGADDYTLKPLNPEEFLAKIKALLKKKPREKKANDEHHPPSPAHNQSR